MAKWLPSSPKDIAELMSSKLSVNPLLLSLFALSPADALEHLGVGGVAGWLNMRRVVSAGDRAQVERVLAALRDGRTQLDTTQQVTAVQSDAALLGDLLASVEASLSSASALAGERQGAVARPAPDMTLSVARTTLQYVLRIYAQNRFIGHSFRATPQPWLDVEALGRMIAIDLTAGGARIVAHFDGVFTGSAQIAGQRFVLFVKRSPIEIDVSAAFSVNPAGQLCIGVGAGAVRVPGLPLPAMFIEALFQHVRTALSAVPIVYLPLHVDVPDATGVISDEVHVRVSHISVTEQALTLEFQLFFGPSASANPL